ncbi:transposable element Tcb1 transposase [Trichonephila clavipes]|nr:transposable element Tcb1 transposase [Trichonephila clavipes]
MAHWSIKVRHPWTLGVRTPRTLLVSATGNSLSPAVSLVLRACIVDTTTVGVCDVFRQESRFRLQSDFKRTVVWRVCQVPINTKRTSLDDTVSVVQDCSVLGGILGSSTDQRVQTGIMISQIYREVTLQKHVSLFRDPIGAEIVFMDDNACPYRAKIVSGCLHPPYGQATILTRHESIRICIVHACLMSCSPSTTCFMSAGKSERAFLDEWCTILQDRIHN